MPLHQNQKITAKDKLLKAAFSLIRTQGYSQTTVDELCETAGVTKGSFFHYFDTKEALAIAAAQHWSTTTAELFREASFHRHKDPLDRFLGYIDFRKELLRGKLPEFTCLIGTMVQEAYMSNPEIRQACEDSIFGHAETLVPDVKEAIRLHKPNLNVSAESLALHTQTVIQGAFILAKAKGDASMAAESIDHLKNYVQLLFKK